MGAQLRARDPAGRGLPSAAAVRLLRALLSWNPGARPTAEQARGWPTAGSESACCHG